MVPLKLHGRNKRNLCWCAPASCVCLCVQEENGPLEASWGVAAMARSLEMLKGFEWSSPELQVS
jgi:hypothetical protein